MKRSLLALTLVLVAALATAGCCEKKVTVQTGEKVVCTYGETVSSTVHSVQVPESQAGKYKITVKKVTCARHKTIEALYAAAQKALADKDLKSAREKLAQVVELEASFRKASEQLKQIEAGQTPAPDTSQAGTGGSTGGGTTPESPADSLTTWVPDKLTGYTAQPIIVDPVALTRDYLPTSAGDVAAIVIVAEQYPTANTAKNRTLETIARAYSASRQQVTVEGRTLEFGTNGGKFAALAWNEGSIGIAIEAASSGKPAASLKDDLEKIAAELIK